MTDFSIKFEQNSDIPIYLEQFRKNIKKTPLFDVKLFIEDDMAFFHIRPLFFPLYWLSPCILTIGYFIGGFNWPLLIIACIPGITVLVYMKHWYILFLYIGKWKGRYRGKFRVL